MNSLYFLVQALYKLRPNALWTINGEDYSGLIWKDENQTKPTEDEVILKINELKDLEPYKILRKHRDKLLEETDWWAVSDRTMTPEQLNYRQALRDLPETATPILDSLNHLGISGVDWPIKPQ